MYPDSKSEGMAAFLLTEGDGRAQLYRPDHYPMDDEFFSPYSGKAVEVEGEAEENGFIAVHAIRCINDETETV